MKWEDRTPEERLKIRKNQAATWEKLGYSSHKLASINQLKYLAVGLTIGTILTMIFA